MAKRIEDTLNAYFEGIKLADSSIMKPSFHEKATMYGFDAGNNLISEGPIENLYAIIDDSKVEPDYEFEYAILGQTENTASVKVDIYLKKDKVHMIDFHNMLRIDGDWVIISKTYQVL